MALFLSQALGGAAFTASITVAALVAAQLTGTPAWAGTPASLLQVGTAFAALAVGASTDRIGRRWGLSLGLAGGVLGAGLAAGALVAGSFWLLLGGSVLMGAASAAMQLARFSAAEVHYPENRGLAISHVVIGGTVGAVVGPLLIGPSGRWMQQAGMDELAGPFLAAVVLFTLSALVTWIGLRPDPRDVGRQIAVNHPDRALHQGPTRPTSQLFRCPTTVVATSAMVLSRIAMVLVMAMTSLHMEAHQHALSGISLVISAHTFGMYALSTVSGRLADRWGRGPVILAGSAMLVLACALAPMSSDLLPLSFSLFLLGLGWNLCYVGGSALLSDQLGSEERGKIQGANDFLMNLAAAAASLASGLVFVAQGFAVLSLVAAMGALLLMGLVARWLAKQWRSESSQGWALQEPCP